MYTGAKISDENSFSFVQHQICFVSTTVRIKGNRTQKTLIDLYISILLVSGKRKGSVQRYRNCVLFVLCIKITHVREYTRMYVRLHFQVNNCWADLMKYIDVYINIQKYGHTRHLLRRSFSAHYASNSQLLMYVPILPQFILVFVRLSIKTHFQ